MSILEINNIEEFLLGWWLNDDGVRFCSVYTNALPQEVKNNLIESHSRDVWDQVCFSDVDDFIENVEAGYATASPSLQEHLDGHVDAQQVSMETE